MFINAPGSGKTRLLFDGLCQSWGLYFISQPDSSSLGSTDLDFGIRQSIPRSVDFTEDLSRSTDLASALEHNRTIAHGRFNEIILARVMVLAQFIVEVEEAGLDLQSMKATWLLMQLLPSKMRSPEDKDDIFTQLALQFSRATTTDVENHVRWLLRWIRRKLGQEDHPLFCVIDEAPIAATQLTKSFRDSSTLTPRPVLRELVAAWARFNLGTSTDLNAAQLRFILSGTGINATLVNEAIRSAVSKALSVDTVYTTGTFDETSLFTYLRSYIPENVLKTDEGEVLLRRIWYWVGGRYKSLFKSLWCYSRLTSRADIASLQPSWRSCFAMGSRGRIIF